MKRIVTSLCSTVVALSGVTFTANAQDNDWWFEIEVLLFKRDRSAADIAEQFSPEFRVAQYYNPVDLLTPYLYPDVSLLRANLPQCEPESEPLPTIEDIIASYEEYLAAQQALYADSLDPFANESLQEGENADDADVLDNEDQQQATDDLVTALLEADALESDTAEYENLETEGLEEFAPDSLEASRLRLAALTAAREAFEKDLAESLAFFDEQRFALPDFIPNKIGLCLSELDNPIAAGEKPETWFATVTDMPVKINGIETLFAPSPYLIPSDMLQLSELFRDISRQRNVSPLMHIGWRQQVLFGRDRAKFVRLFAGHNFAERYAADGSPIIVPPEEAPIEAPIDDISTNDPFSVEYTESTEAIVEDAPLDIIETIRARLADPNSVAKQDDEEETREPTPENLILDKLWELDGLFKVYLQYINRVPYLHIDSELNFRSPLVITEDVTGFPLKQPVTDNVMDSQMFNFEFSQLRRVISKQIHYFDHPLFGMVVQIRRHERPEPEIDESDIPTEQ